MSIKLSEYKMRYKLKRNVINLFVIKSDLNILTNHVVLLCFRYCEFSQEEELLHDLLLFFYCYHFLPLDAQLLKQSNIVPKTEYDLGAYDTISIEY